MMLMSIDQSLSSTGITIWTLHPIMVVVRSDKGCLVVDRIRQITDQIRAYVKTYSVTHVVVESLPYGINSTSVRPLAGLYYCIANMCKDLNIEFAEANVTAVKKYFTGSGKAKKEDMIETFKLMEEELYLRLFKIGFKKTTGLADLADSYAIGKYYRSTLEGTND